MNLQFMGNTGLALLDQIQFKIPYSHCYVKLSTPFNSKIFSAPPVHGKSFIGKVWTKPPSFSTVPGHDLNSVFERWKISAVISHITHWLKPIWLQNPNFSHHNKNNKYWIGPNNSSLFFFLTSPNGEKNPQVLRTVTSQWLSKVEEQTTADNIQILYTFRLQKKVCKCDTVSFSCSLACSKCALSVQNLHWMIFRKFKMCTPSRRSFCIIHCVVLIH